jgi:hypothetical protein
VLVEPEWPTADALIETARLSLLEPLRADALSRWLPSWTTRALHRYIGGRPATGARLHDLYRRQEAGRSASMHF